MSTPKLLISLFEYKAWADEALLAALGALPGDMDPEQRHNAIRIFNHIHVVDSIFAAHLERRPHGFAATNTPETPTLEALGESVRRLDRWYLGYLPTLDAQALDEQIEFVFTDDAPGRLSREEMLAHVVTHGGYYRGGIGRLLVQMSATPPRDVYTGFLHKTEPAQRERA